MHSRRHDAYMRLSPSSRPRSSNLRGRTEMGHGHDPHVIRQRDAPDRFRRSPSPRKAEGSRRVLESQTRSRSTERRGYDCHLVGGRPEKIRIRSPRYGQFPKRPDADVGDEVVNRRYGYHENVDYGAKSGLKHVYGYECDQGSSRLGKESGYPDDVIVDVETRGLSSQKLVPIEDSAVGASYRLTPDTRLTREYDEPSRNIPLLSRSIDVEQYEHEKLQYCDQIPSDKLLVMDYYNGEKPVYYSRDRSLVTETYKEGDNQPMFHSRDSLYTMVPTSHSNDFVPRFKEYAGTSSGASVNEFPVSYQDSFTVPASDGYQRSTVKLTEANGIDAYGQKSLTENIRGGTEAKPRNMTYYQHGVRSPSRTEREDYIYTKSRMIDADDLGYLSGDIRRAMPTHSRQDYDIDPVDCDHQDLSRRSHRLSVMDRIESVEHPRGNLMGSSALEYPTYQKQTVSNYLDISRKPYTAFKEDEEYFQSGPTDADLERTGPRAYGMSHMGVPQKCEISYSTSDHAFGRNADEVIQKERFQYSSDPYYDSERHKLALRAERNRGELDIHEKSDKSLKRKSGAGGDMNRRISVTSRSTRWNVPEDYEDLYGTYDEYACEEGLSVAHSSNSGRFNQNEYRKARRTYEGQERPGNFTSDGRFSSRDSFSLSSRSSVKFYSHNNRHIKGQTRPSSSGWHYSQQSDKRGGHHKQHKILKRSENYDDDAWGNDDDASDDCLTNVEVEPSEDSEEFKQLVQKAFLLYSKKLNLHSSIRRRYKEQGKAGSLFCIACGKSVSKEFKDTQRLVTHAFMCLKVGLRARHLGLHKAVCVLLGWNTVVPYDTKTWVPEVLPESEAMAQKEDLILWPPLVIIRNISMSNNNPKEQKVIPIEQIEAFLRGKGFGRGKITVSLGRPADQSIMVVKFLGTFTGLSNAERLHNYLAENKHGRADFNLLTSNDGSSSSSSVQEGTEGEKLEEKLLYGYMGISEDLDGVDFNSKKYCIIKSKKEIMDLANAPVKPDDM